MNKTIKSITRSGIMLALLIVLQWSIGQFGLQLLTGSIVNIILVLSTFVCGLFGSIVIAGVSPFIALILGISKFPSLIITGFVGVANVAYVVAIYLLVRYIEKKKVAKLSVLYSISVVIIASCLKVAITYFGGAIFGSYIAKLSEAQTNALSVALGVNQYITAMIGGISGMIIMNVFLKSIKGKIRLD